MTLKQRQLLEETVSMLESYDWDFFHLIEKNELEDYEIDRNWDFNFMMNRLYFLLIESLEDIEKIKYDYEDLWNIEDFELWVDLKEQYEKRLEEKYGEVA